jgi:ketosteroid isomerase-like protein
MLNFKSGSPIHALSLATMLATTVPVLAQEQPESAGVKLAAQAFYNALSQRDMAAMEEVWAIDAPTVLINPRDKSASIGWQAVKTNWKEAFAFWSDLKVSPRDMNVRVFGDVASVASVALVEGRTRDGKPATFTALNTQLFEKKDDRWVLVSHHSSRAPD